MWIGGLKMNTTVFNPCALFYFENIQSGCSLKDCVFWDFIYDGLFEHSVEWDEMISEACEDLFALKELLWSISLSSSIPMTILELSREEPSS